MTKEQRVYTIGYEGTDIASFSKRLSEVGVTLLADVRELPLSRKKGFSKNGLREELIRHGIEYLHLKSLGDPKPGREAARQGRYEEFEKIFLDHLATSEAQTSLEQLQDVSESHVVCMMCFEKDHTHCHRHIVSDALAKRFGTKVEHISVS